MVLAWSAFLEGSIVAGRVLGGAALPNSGALGALSTRELGGPIICRAMG